jgi:hypothetical protein
LTSQRHQEQLNDDTTFRETLRELRLADDDVSRAALVMVVQRVDSLKEGATRSVSEPRQEMASGTAIKRADESADDLKRTLLESYAYIRWTFWVSFGMSIVVFLVGLVLVGIAIARSIGEESISGGTLTIAGLGIADFLLLFYSKPWRDIAENLAKSQRIKMVATSYLAGLALTRPAQPDALRLLSELTHDSVRLLGPELPEPSALVRSTESKSASTQAAG